MSIIRGSTHPNKTIAYRYTFVTIFYRLCPKKTIIATLVSHQAPVESDSCEPQPNQCSEGAAPSNLSGPEDCHSSISIPDCDKTEWYRYRIHHIVLCLGQQGNGTGNSSSVSLKDLKNMLKSRQLYLGKTGLLKLINRHWKLFRVEAEDVSLCELNAWFMQEYFFLANVKRINSSYLGKTRSSLSSNAYFEVSDVICVRGLISATCNANEGSELHFVFGNMFYKIASPLAEGFQQRQKLEAVLCFRKHWQR
jgi:hypothetical protein